MQSTFSSLQAPATTSTPPRPKNPLGQLATALLNFFTAAQDPKVASYQVDGQTLYSAYDPMTGTRMDYASEAEMRIWLEQRYNA